MISWPGVSHLQLIFVLIPISAKAKDLSTTPDPDQQLLAVLVVFLLIPNKWMCLCVGLAILYYPLYSQICFTAG